MSDRTIGSITALQRGNSYKSKLLGDEGPKLLGLGSIQKDGGFKDSALKSYSGPTDPRHLLRPGDMYVSLKDVTQSGDLLGSIARVPAHIELGRLTQDTVKLEFIDAEFSRSYVYWALRTPQYRSYCRARALGTTNLSLSRDDFLSFTLPPLTSFRSILVEVLENLEEKIELNRRMAATLEEMARALYRSWFVDFDPVKAKAEGLTPAFMDEATAALFPNRFGEDGLPEGWQVQPLLDIMDILSGGTPKTSVSDFWDGDIPWASAKDVSQCGQVFLISTERKITAAGLSKSSTKIIPALSTVVVARGATTGRVCMFGENIAMNQTCYALKSRNGAPFFANCMFVNEVLGITLAAHGSVFDTITTKTLQATTVISPPEKLSSRFEENVTPMFERILELTRENQTLAALRDTLLPKLMSGELRVGEAREQVEEVA